MWQTIVARLALLEILVSGTLRQRRAQVDVWRHLAGLPWTRLTGRRDELALIDCRRHEIVSLLDRVWPAWSAALAALTARGLPPTPEGWRDLEDAERAQDVPVLPDQVNRRTAAALVAPHSKAALTERRLAALGAAQATHDGSVRVRPPGGLIARGPEGQIDLSGIAAVLGEVSLPERALRGGLTLEGPIRAVLTIENLGAFCDLPALDGWLLVHIPGWDSATAACLLERLTQVPLIHFGDLDPNGVRILQHLRNIRADVGWFVPGFWAEFMEARGQPGVWPAGLDLGEAPELVRRLAGRSLWLEQEAIVVDPRLAAELEATI
jgi:hypothetical protein